VRTLPSPGAVVWTPERVAAWQATGKRPKVAVWTPEQTGEFLDHAADDRLYALYHLIAFRGLRRGEAVGLSWTDLDLDHGLLSVSWQIVQLSYATEGGEPKADSARAIALDTETIAVLRAHRPRRLPSASPGVRLGSTAGASSPARTGSELDPEYVTRHFERLSRQAGLPPIRLHDLRHGAATLALAGGADLKTVSEMLGHSTIVITADTYTSVLPKVARQAAESAAAVVPRSRRPNTDPSANASAPISHPSGGGAGHEDSSSDTNVQVRRVRRLGLEPRTRGLKEGGRACARVSHARCAGVRLSPVLFVATYAAVSLTYPLTDDLRRSVPTHYGSRTWCAGARPAAHDDHGRARAGRSGAREGSTSSTPIDRPP